MTATVATDQVPGDAQTGEEEALSLLRAAAGLSLSAALIHASVITVHFREYWPFGLLFAITAVAQLVWGLVVWSRPDARALLALGAVANIAVAAVWFVSRTFGLPAVPDRAAREAVGIHDVLATTQELMLAGLVAWFLLAPRRTDAAEGMVALAWVLAAAGVIVALLGGHGT